MVANSTTIQNDCTYLLVAAKFKATTRRSNNEIITSFLLDAEFRVVSDDTIRHRECAIDYEIDNQPQGLKDCTYLAVAATIKATTRHSDIINTIFFLLNEEFGKV